jgi:hypothetical protein
VAYIEIHTYDTQLTLQRIQNIEGVYQKLCQVWSDTPLEQLNTSPDAKPHQLPLVAMFPPAPLETRFVLLILSSLLFSYLLSLHSK